MSTSLINTLLSCLSALAIAAVLLLGTTIDDHSAERDQADALQDAIKDEAMQARVARAIADLCGENAVARPTNNPREYQCITKRGYVTKTKGTI